MVATQAPGLGTGLTNPSDPRHPRYLQQMHTSVLDAASGMRTVETERNQAKAELARTTRRLRERGDELAAEVADDPTCSNADKRKAELARRLRLDAVALALQGEID